MPKEKKQHKKHGGFHVSQPKHLVEVRVYGIEDGEYWGSIVREHNWDLKNKKGRLILDTGRLVKASTLGTTWEFRLL